ncbi:MAG: hypothetical protein ABSG92_05110 [Conexivisphaerales archaeon]
MASKIKDTSIIDAVLKMDKRIRYASILSDDLKEVAQKMQPGTTPYSPPFIDEVVVPIIAGMFKRLTEYAGEFELCRINYKKVRLMVHKLRDGYLVVSAEPSLDLDPICNRISLLV